MHVFHFLGKLNWAFCQEHISGKHNPQLESEYPESTVYVCMHIRELPLRMPKSLVHNVRIDFSHGSNIVRSNCMDRSIPKNNTALIFRVCAEPKSVSLAYEADAFLIASDSIVMQKHFTHRNKACSSAWHVKHLGELDYFLIPSVVV